MKRPVIIAAAIFAALGGLFYLLNQHTEEVNTSGGELVVHCAAGLQKPVRKIAEEYEKEYGTKVKLNFAGSGALESQLKVAGGDLFIPADYSYIERTRAEGLIREAEPIAMLHAVIVVKKGNPKGIQSLDDLASKGVRLSVAEPSAAVGKYVKKVLSASGDWEKIEPNIVVTKPTVNNVIEDVAGGAVDAGLAWDAVALQFPEVEVVRVPVFEEKPRKASVGVIKGAKTPQALHFMRYLAAKDRGREVFESMGFAVPEVADKWADVPVVTLFSGSMLRPAIEDKLKEFEKREGCQVNTAFEGCGTLVSMMKDAGAKPGAYFSCDMTFLDMVQDKFEHGELVSSNEIILLVPKGNSKGLKTLQDLKAQALKVGLADAEKSALGKLTKDMLVKENLWDDLHASGNIVVLVSKGDDLVNQMQSGALDAALLYRSNAKASKAISTNCEIIELGDSTVIATQPYAVAKDAEHPRLMARLRDFITSDEARAHYEDLGFTWKKGAATDE